MRGAGAGGGEIRNIYIVRHPEAEHHVKKLAGGWYDTSLTEKGKEQANKIAKNLFREIKITGIPIYSSDLKRCSETAEHLSQIFNSSVTLDKNLRERNFGEAGGKTLEWCRAHVILLPEDNSRIDHCTLKGAETIREAGTRAHNFINNLLEKPDDNVIIITHGSFTNYLCMAWLKVPVEYMGYADFQGQSGGVTLLNEDDMRKNRNIIYLNRMDFLEG